MRNVSLMILATLAYCTVTLAQFQFGSVVGLIKDASQAPVPGATIEIRSQSTNVARQATASPAGEYNFVSLPPDNIAHRIQLEPHWDVFNRGSGESQWSCGGHCQKRSATD